MNRLIDRYCRLLEGLCVFFLAIMVVLVFGNVVLRYAFNSGIAVSDEVSRWLFVWMTFLGAIVALREHGHLGTDLLVSRLPVAGKKVCLLISQAVMLFLTWLMFSGSLQQAQINLDVEAPATGASVAIFYGVGVVFAVSTAVLLLLDIWRTITGQLSEADLVQTKESEDSASVSVVAAPEPGPSSAKGALDSSDQVATQSAGKATAANDPYQPLASVMATKN